MMSTFLCTMFKYKEADDDICISICYGFERQRGDYNTTKIFLRPRGVFYFDSPKRNQRYVEMSGYKYTGENKQSFKKRLID